MLMLGVVALYLQLAIERTEQEIEQLQTVIQAQEQQREQLELTRDLLQEVILLRNENEQLRRQVEDFMDTWTIAEFETTAYTLECGYPWDDGITFTGTEAVAGQTIAVDPDVIPLGSQVWVDGFGWMMAEDVGGAIKGEIVDIYMGAGPDARRLAMRWGRQTAKVVYKR